MEELQRKRKYIPDTENETQCDDDEEIVQNSQRWEDSENWEQEFIPNQKTCKDTSTHAGFVQDSLSVVSASDDDDDLPLSIWARALDKGLPMGNEELEQYSAIDDDLATCEEPTDENILQSVIHNGQDSDDNDDDGLEENCTTPTLSEALKAAEVLNVEKAAAKMENCKRHLYKSEVY
ncbi:hypothetical protein PYW07_006237 [Mythimna separata]|uniref:Uncharacterized protein n=1 Tax=Mythimna separata TaxID=271217 RepID=A0AAD8DX97_MYTSE|nr:hypothetical protein PYW07_006237 [Mythimna separata]